MKYSWVLDGTQKRWSQMRSTKAEELNDDDDANMYGHNDSFMVELRIDAFQDVTAMKEHKMDIEVSTIIGTDAKIVKQVSSWRPAGITWVRGKPKAAALTPKHCCIHIG